MLSTFAIYRQNPPYLFNYFSYILYFHELFTLEKKGKKALFENQ